MSSYYLKYPLSALILLIGELESFVFASFKMKRSSFWELRGMVTGPKSANGLLIFTKNKDLNPENLLDFCGTVSDYDPSTYLFSGQGVLRMISGKGTI